MKHIEDFKNYMIERGMSEQTIYNYTLDLNQFFTVVNKPVTRITADDISEFILTLRNKGDQISTTNRKLSAIKSFFNFLVRKKKLKYNPATAVEGARRPKRLPRPIDESEVTKIFNTIDNLRDRTIFEVLYGTGIRREELCKIHKSDIDFANGEMRVVGKGDKERIVPLLPRTMDYMKRLLEEHRKEWLFPSIKTGSHLTTRQINDIVKKWTEKAGLEWVTPHKFRHAFATSMFNNGAELKAIQDILGHASPETTQIYTRISTKRNKEELKKYHPLANGQLI